jgi:hypothetical protein
MSVEGNGYQYKNIFMHICETQLMANVTQEPVAQPSVQPSIANLDWTKFEKDYQMLESTWMQVR